LLGPGLWRIRNSGNRWFVDSRSIAKAPRSGFRKGDNMKYLFAAALVAGTFASFGSAYAEGGCGPGFHRNAYGECRPNRGPVVVVPGAVVVERPGVVVVPGRACPIGFVWRYGRCRPI
jgi:hypothetical protein